MFKYFISIPGVVGKTTVTKQQKNVRTQPLPVSPLFPLDVAVGILVCAQRSGRLIVVVASIRRTVTAGHVAVICTHDDRAHQFILLLLCHLTTMVRRPPTVVRSSSQKTVEHRSGVTGIRLGATQVWNVQNRLLFHTPKRHHLMFNTVFYVYNLRYIEKIKVKYIQWGVYTVRLPLREGRDTEVNYLNYKILKNYRVGVTTQLFIEKKNRWSTLGGLVCTPLNVSVVNYYYYYYYYTTDLMVMANLIMSLEPYWCYYYN